MATDRFTTTQLIDDVKIRATVPTSQTLFGDDSILLLMDDELHSLLVPLIMTVREDYFVDYEDFTMVSGQTEYQIPSAAVGLKVREIEIVDSDGAMLKHLIRTDPERLNSETLYGFYFRSDKIVLTDAASKYSGGLLRISYFRRCNKLVKTSEAGKIVSANSNTGEVLLASVPSTWVQGDFVCVQTGVPGASARIISAEILLINGTVVTVNADVSEIVAGDWMCLEGEAVIPQIPQEGFPLLCQATVVKILEALGGSEQNVGIAQQKYTQLEAAFLVVINPRTDSNSRKIVNDRGIFRSGR